MAWTYGIEWYNFDYVHMMPVHFENGRKFDGKTLVARRL